MAELKEPRPVKLFAGILYREETDLALVRSRLEKEFGPIDYTSDSFPFQVTSYYEREMGTDLKRVFLSFAHLINPGELASIKVRTNRLEEDFSQEGNRRVNLDPGYLDFFKIVLASGKPTGQKIYLNQGVYADLTLYYDKGWKPYNWGFPDFRAGTYDQVFTTIRNLYKRQCREQSASPGTRGVGIPRRDGSDEA
ncbi:MAG: DUF4416 family protein [candidate division NC10 bacterium]|nr:DUF4416 family protein [candidate division NC10 bacterium]